MRSPEPLPFHAIELLFERLTLTYGHHFRARWSGIALATVKEDWRHQLAGITPPQIDFALATLPAGEPPDAPTFRQLARSMPVERPQEPGLPPKRGPVNVPPEVRKELDRLRARKDDPRPMRVQIADKYVCRFGNEPHLTSMQRENLKHYLGILTQWNRRKAHGEAEQQEGESL
jgi:hypothetical protein